MKKLVLAILVLLCSVSIDSFAATGYLFQDEANFLHSLKLLDGINKDRFDPDLGSSLTRAQGVTCVLKLFGQKEKAEELSDAEVSSLTGKFKDIKNTDWFAKYVAYSVKNNISSGCSPDTWMPDAHMQGKQLAKMILNELGYTNPDEYPYEKALVLLSQMNGFHVYTSVNYSDLSNTYLNRDNAVGIVYSTLTAYMSGSNTMVAVYLVDNHIVPKEYFVGSVLLDNKSLTNKP